MALYLHLGVAGVGKSFRLYDMVTTEAEKDFNRSFLFIVPEQFTLQTQRNMIAMSRRGGIMNIDVLSFPRLAHRVFEDQGLGTPVTLEDTGKTMIVKKVALDKLSELGIYAGKIHRQGFISEMKSVIAEFYQYGIDDERLEAMLQMAKDKPQLYSKMKDIAVIYKSFREYIDGRFIMNEELLEQLIVLAPNAEVLKGACVCFDNFTGFTVMQLRVIECLMKIGCDVHVALTITEEAAERYPSPDNLFYLSQKTIEKLSETAEKTDTKIIKRVYSAKIPYRFRNAPDLAVLERNVFRNAAKIDAVSSAIRMLSCENPLAEVRYTVGEMIRLAADGGMKYGSAAVIVGDINVYGRLIDREFTAAGIPFFLDSKRNIVGTAPVEMLRAVLEAAGSDMTYESVFRFLKTGLTGITEEETEQLENFVLARAVRGVSMWKRTWKGGYKTRYKVDMLELNKSRAKVARLLGKAVEELKQKELTVRERIAVLQWILDYCKVEKRLEKKAEEGRRSEDAAKRSAAIEAGQLYEMIQTVFERLNLLLGDDIISEREFEELLNTGFSEAKLATLPQGTDNVVIGDLERTRLDSVSTLFFLGVNEGMIPAVAGDGGLLSDADRSIFAENDIELSPTKRENAYLNEFYMYLSLTKPLDRLYLLHHRMTADKKPGRPSYIYGKIKRLFNNLNIEALYGLDENRMLAGGHGMSAAAEILRDRESRPLSDTERTLLSSIKLKRPAAYERMLDAAFYRHLPESITPQNARKLYGDVLTGSVTRLETFAACAFRHFINYGLRLEERAEYEIGSVEIGNIYHKALECYCKGLKERGIAWHDTTEDVRAELEAKAVEDAFAGYEELINNSKRNEYIKTRVTRIMSRTVDILDAQVKAGSFEPEFFEKTFSHTGEFMALEGKIDRMDICEQNGRKVLRVIDYKSGTKSFDLLQLFYGLQIQLAVYMREGLKDLRTQYGDATFAGMYYYNIDDPIVEAEGDAGTVKAAIEKALKLSGPSEETGRMLRLHDSAIATADGTLTSGYSSNVISAEVTKKGELGRYAKVLSEQNFETLGRFVEQSIEDKSKEILSGKASLNPYEMGNKTACEYCSYKGICGFERQLGDSYRSITAMSEEEIWRTLNGAQSSVE